jgi:hypothetical protein
MKKIAFLLAMAVITALPAEAQLLQTIKKAAQKAEQ